jgi:hypothetical protein
MDDFSETDLLAELDGYFCQETRQEGDIDARMISERFGLSINAARCHMRRIAMDGKYKIVTVKEENYFIKVLRKV